MQPAPAQGRLTGLVEKTAETAESLYAGAKARLPEAARPTVASIEKRVAEVATPIAHKAQDTGATLLRSADEHLDTALGAASRVYADNSAYLQAQLSRQAEFHRQNVATYKQAREAYLKRVEDAVEWVKREGLTGAARSAADEVLARVGEAKAAALGAPAALLRQVQAAVDALLALGPVHSALEAARPSLAAAQGQYARLHGSVVSSPQYAKAFSLTADVAQRAQRTWLYGRVLPLARPAVDTVASSPYYSALVQHLQPVEASA